MAGFHATPSRRITVLYSIIVYVIRFKSHHYIDNRRYENDGLGRIGVSGQTSRELKNAFQMSAKVESLKQLNLHV